MADTADTRRDEQSVTTTAAPRAPRRAAVQGLAALAALGAASLVSERAAGKQGKNGESRDKSKSRDKNKSRETTKSSKGKGKGKGGANPPPSGALVAVKVIDTFGSVDPGKTGDANAVCPAPGKNQQVFVLGGGFSAIEADLRLVVGSADNESSPPSYTVTVQNTSQTEGHEFGAQAICAYFRK